MVEIIKNPNEISKLNGSTGQPLKADEVCLRAVSLLKTIINTCWNVSSDDKENQHNNGQQMQQPGQFTSQITPSDKEFIRAEIFNCMDLYPSENFKKIR